VAVVTGIGTTLARRLRPPAPSRGPATETALIGKVLVAERERISVGTAFWRVMPLVLALVMMLGAAVISVRSAQADRERFTVLSLVSAPDSADHPGGRSAVVAVRCEESGITEYRLRVQGDNGFRQSFTVTLRRGATWSHELQVPATGGVIANLFKGADETPYRTVFLAATG
jgi:hypothetical protein